MFLNKTILKKFIKSSFKQEGLTVGRIYGGLVVAGGTWITWTEEGYVPNWLKAAVMEYTGELPQKGYVFKAKKDEPIHYEIAENELYNIPEVKKKCAYAYTVTPVVIERYGQGCIRFMQQKSTLRMFAIPEDKYKILDLSELGEENAPAGPASVSPAGGLMLYKNEHSAYAFIPLDGMYGITERISDCVDRIDFDKEDET